MPLLTDEQLRDLAGSTFPQVKSMASELLCARAAMRHAFNECMLLSNTDAARRGQIADQLRAIATNIRPQLPELQPPEGNADDPDHARA